MLNRILAAAAAIALSIAVSACATSRPAERHQHLRDTKQGSTLPEPAAGAQAPRKPLHDHRQMK